MASKGGLTEAEWLGCSDPRAMLEFLPDAGNERKFRLFGCACARRVWDLLPEAGQLVVDACEEQADGVGPARNLAGLSDRVWAGGIQNLPSGKALGYAAGAARTCTSTAPRWAAQAWEPAASALAWHAAAQLPPWTLVRPAWDAALESARQLFCRLLRDLFVPFRPVVLDPSWLAWERGVVRHLADDIYRGRDFAKLPVLADALEDAGCADEGILRHCRDESEHARGCWILDAVLGR